MIVVWSDVWCDGVGCTFSVDGHMGVEVKRREARKTAKLHGWGTVIDDGTLRDLCPGCLAQYKQKDENP